MTTSGRGEKSTTPDIKICKKKKKNSSINVFWGKVLFLFIYFFGRSFTFPIQINPFCQLRILYCSGQHRNEAISTPTPNTGAQISRVPAKEIQLKCAKAPKKRIWNQLGCHTHPIRPAVCDRLEEEKAMPRKRQKKQTKGRGVAILGVCVSVSPSLIACRSDSR